MATARAVRIDGSFGEGGGSVLRIAAGLSAATGLSVEIDNIRRSRPRPGLAPQHLTGLKALARLFSARTKGLQLGSTKVEYSPGLPTCSRLDVDVGTAGSIGLMLQTLMIPLPFVDAKVEISLTGGTHVPWSPNVDYLRNVTLPVLARMGYSAEADVLAPGYYPKGGGRVDFTAEPTGHLDAIELDDFGDVERIQGISRSSNLPGHIAGRQASAAAEALGGVGDPHIEILRERSLSPGTAITLWAATTTGSTLGASALGKRGKPAEDVGAEAGSEMSSYLDARTPLDPYLLDQILPYAAMARGRSVVKCHKFTMHAKTNIYVVEKFFGGVFDVEGDIGQPCTINVQGVGLCGGGD